MTTMKNRNFVDEIRPQLLEEVGKFFTGPTSGDEVLPAGNLPSDMYVSGILFPVSTIRDELDKEGEDESDKEESDMDAEHQSAVIFKQNSIGLRVRLKEGVTKIDLKVDYGKYVHNEDGRWARYRPSGGGYVGQIDLLRSQNRIDILGENDVSEARVWWMLHDDTLSIFLENPTRYETMDAAGSGYDETRIKNEQNCIFQPSIRLGSVDEMNTFEAISSAHDKSGSWQGTRRKDVFGIGYSCGAEWGSGDPPTYVETTLLPIFRDSRTVKFADTDEEDRPTRIDMFELGCYDNLENYDGNREKIQKLLSPMIEKYEHWIEKQNGAIGSLSEDESNMARMNIDECNQVRTRMNEGLRLLTDDTNPECRMVLKAFILANRAMLHQRQHFKYSLKRSKNSKSKEPWPVPGPEMEKWYPFQIGFILMSLCSLVSKNHSDNSTADLIWFPTGGGKTEAYLGAAAFVMILRRLKGDIEDGLGVSVIMRYTLRLLTLQQFERASTLICALEVLRRDEKNKLGSEPFLLGLWVGGSLTPNYHKYSCEALDDLRKNRNIQTKYGSPWQTYYCPWCGDPIGPKNYLYDGEKTLWTLVRCSNDKGKCPFTDKNFHPAKILPLVTVDTDVYTRCPSMIIATVDKFARMPFKSDIANIFGRPQRKCERHGFLPTDKMNCTMTGVGRHKTGESVRSVNDIFPPDLIIQDELHLISGPLGTMVGLYETAVDFLTRDKDNFRPKVIASTATAQGAGDQIRKIFNLNKTQPFPPAGVMGDDTFFWWSENAGVGKIFAGVSFSHRSTKYALAKLYSILLQKIEVIHRQSGETDLDVDPYWTLVGYYNSIRELGGANRLIEDDISRNMRFLAKNKYKIEVRDLGEPENGIEELTGRKTQKEINMVRNKLEKRFESDDAISVLLATSMISVGIDIERLALMVINGQPKSVTEYIQVSGRIGRREEEAPGCVFTLFNPYKPRDLSHYENFVGFHSTMRTQIEPAALSPFSISACNRGLHSVFISMMRLSEADIAQNKNASMFRHDHGISATKFILERFKSVEQVDENHPAYKYFNGRLKAFQEEWCKLVDAKNGMVSYTEEVSHAPLIVEFAKKGGRNPGKFPISTPESLRNVEQQIQMRYV